MIYGGLALFTLFLIGFEVVGYWGIFSKTGEKGWKALIPFYNLYTFVKVSEQKGILFLLLLLPGVNIVFSLICLKKLAARFGKGFGFAIGLFLLPGIFALILGFGKAECLNPKEPEEEEPYYYYYKPKF
ncbi:MAG: hypothetical protein IJJ41_02700 [Clostridia bacterium]|nr:hypothetical protein [Clostridia bacterium]